MITFGLIINPYAGIGGAVGLKGSDGEHIVKEALARGAKRQANERSRQTLIELLPFKDKIKFITAPAEMGEDLLKTLGFNYQVIAANIPAENTRALHTKMATEAIVDSKVDILLFAGGDGTARDICSVINDQVPVLGIPAGVKIHSSVYGITPKATAEVLIALLKGDLVDIRDAEVRDLDEEAFRNNQVRAMHYGDMRVPQLGHFVQSVKQGGVESEELVLADIAAWLIESMDEDTLYFIGSGKTTAAIMHELGLGNTLLGVDAVLNKQLIGQDLSANDIKSLVERYSQVKIIVSIMGGQGHIFGRGNQQFSAEILSAVGKENIILVSAKSKITDLEGRPLVMDSGDSELDSAWAGTIEITTGYRDQIVHALY